MRKSDEEGRKKHEGPTPQNIILSGLTGSHAYGLNHDGFEDVWGNFIEPSDIDTRGVFVIPTKEILSLGKHKELIEQKTTDTKYDEIERFISLCLNCNPERLEMLAWAKFNQYSPHLFMTNEGKMLVENQNIFISKKAINAYGGYATQQRKLLERQENVQRKTKPAMHLIRVMITGIRLLKNGYVDTNMHLWRSELMAIRNGNMSFEEVLEWYKQLETQFEFWKHRSTAPDEPNHKKANEILLEIRKNNLNW